MATTLALYNAALVVLGDRPLSSLSEATEPRRILDGYYTSVLADCLEAGMWNFAKRTVKLDADTSITPTFGPTEVFAKPSDWVRTMAISSDERMSVPLTDYIDEDTYWIADVTPIYVQYVSNDASFGFDLTNWPRSFTRYVELELAFRGCTRLTQNGAKKEDVERDRDRALRRAKNRDAMNENQPQYAPMGSWNSARSGGNSLRERGKTSRLTG